MRFKLAGWTRRLLGPVAMATLLMQATGARAQVAPGGQEVHSPKNITRKTEFSLPIKIDDSMRAACSQVQLYVKVGNGPWQRTDMQQPTQKEFRFKANADGEYWFTLVTVDTNGVPTPSDLNHLANDDIVKVVVDTQPPVFELEPVRLAGDELGVHCDITDANPDYSAVSITYRGPDHVIHMLEPVPGQPCFFRVPGADIFNQPLMASVTDLAKNKTVREVVLTGAMAKLAPRQTPPAQQPRPAQPVQGDMSVQQVSGSSFSNRSLGAFQADSMGTVNPGIVEQRSFAPADQLSGVGSPPRQMLNSTRASIDYRIDHVGPSGVGKVEVWITSDQGMTWRRLCEDSDRHSPAEFDLPGDGLYGVRIVVSNGNGFGGRPPAPGEQAQVWIEVDTAAPVVHLKDAEPVTNGTSLEIRWSATDKNLGPDSINISCSSGREGPWQPIARGVKNDGFYRWPFPRDASGQFFVRVEAVDLAGNVGQSTSANPIVLDMSEPRASVVGVSAAQGQGGLYRVNN